MDNDLDYELNVAYFAKYSCQGTWTESGYRQNYETQSINSPGHSYKLENSIESSLSNLSYQFIIAKSRGRLYGQRICLTFIKIDNRTLGWTAGKDLCQSNGIPGK